MSSASISTRNGILATTAVTDQIPRDIAELAEQTVLSMVPEQDQRMVMSMLFQPPRPTRTGETGKRIYGRLA